MKFKKIAALATATMMAAAVLTGCGSSESTQAPAENAAETPAQAPADAPAKAEAEAAAPGDSGFTEVPIGEEQESADAHINVAAVYFQAVDMKSGEGNTQSGADFTMHIEADIAAMENDLGFVVDQFVPGLTVEYEIVNQANNAVVVKGTFMQMNASDGPHYGANINLNNAGTYTARFIIHSPAENNYFIHTDDDTKPGSTLQKYWPNDKPLSVEFKDWVFDGKKVQPEYN